MMQKLLHEEPRMQIKNTQQLGLGGWLRPAQYWASPEGQRRKALRRLDKCAAAPRDMTPRLVKTGRPKHTASDDGLSTRLAGLNQGCIKDHHD